MSQCPKCGLQMGLHGSILPGCMCFPDTLVFKGHRLPPDDTALLRQALEALEGADEIDCDMRDAINALKERLEGKADPRVQVTVKDFAEMVRGKEDVVGQPTYWAEWPNRSKT